MTMTPMKKIPIALFKWDDVKRTLTVDEKTLLNAYPGYYVPSFFEIIGIKEILGFNLIMENHSPVTDDYWYYNTPTNNITVVIKRKHV